MSRLKGCGWTPQAGHFWEMRGKVSLSIVCPKMFEESPVENSLMSGGGILTGPNRSSLACQRLLPRRNPVVSVVIASVLSHVSTAVSRLPQAPSMA